MNTKPFMTAKEVAALFRVTPRTIGLWASLGKLPHTVTLGGHRRYLRSEIEQVHKHLRRGDAA